MKKIKNKQKKMELMTEQKELKKIMISNIIIKKES